MDEKNIIQKKISIKAVILIITALYLIMLFAVGNAMYQRGMENICNNTNMKLVSYNNTIMCMSQSEINQIRQFETGFDLPAFQLPNLSQKK